MKIYFYAAGNWQCDTVCHYRSCSRRCLFLVERLVAVSDLSIIPSGSNFRSLSSMMLRSGDIIILYARGPADLEELIALGDLLETFRVVLITGEETIIDDGRHFLLNPRFTTVLKKDMDELNVVIDRMAAMPCEYQH